MSVEGDDKFKVVSLHHNGFTGHVGALCDSAPNIDLLATDCRVGIVCSALCCPKCCEDDDANCFEDDLLSNLAVVEGLWELNYKRASYSFDPAILEESAVATIIP